MEQGTQFTRSTGNPVGSLVPRNHRWFLEIPDSAICSAIQTSARTADPIAKTPQPITVNTVSARAESGVASKSKIYGFFLEPGGRSGPSVFSADSGFASSDLKVSNFSPSNLCSCPSPSITVARLTGRFQIL